MKKISDDCSQCEVWAMEIRRLKEDSKTYRQETKESMEILHHRINKSLPRWIFLLMMSGYLGIAAYNAVVIKSLSVDMAKVQTKIESIR